MSVGASFSISLDLMQLDEIEKCVATSNIDKLQQLCGTCFGCV